MMSSRRRLTVVIHVCRKKGTAIKQEERESRVSNFMKKLLQQATASDVALSTRDSSSHVAFVLRLIKTQICETEATIMKLILMTVIWRSCEHVESLHIEMSCCRFLPVSIPLEAGSRHWH
jgi:hypothetical protein